MKLFRNQDKEQIYDTAGVIGSRMAITDNHELVELLLQPGAIISSHLLEIPITFIIIDGSGHCDVNGENIELHPGDAVEVPAGIERSWLNTADIPLKIIGIKPVLSPK
ncbi:cupin domain-containing protein [bacterium]|nr:cupin domain-containing protein [bacterium]